MLLRETLEKWASGFFLGLGWFWAIWNRDAHRRGATPAQPLLHEVEGVAANILK
jgi:hypothetical protein